MRSVLAALDAAVALLTAGDDQDVDDALFAQADRAFPRAGREVDGRVVREKVDNAKSIAATFEDYKVLRGIREVALARFDAAGFVQADDQQKVERLAALIEESSEISPLIVVIDYEGVDKPYVLEGAHRLEALARLKAKALPAMVVVSFDPV